MAVTFHNNLVEALSHATGYIIIFADNTDIVELASKELARRFIHMNKLDYISLGSKIYYAGPRRAIMRRYRPY